ncbi:hypothetical protein ACEWY4_001357 [Coilia grayii]|uniref:Paraneoplastic antigen Ma-like C-terminal domain-containing protein n=1 Tax=Coilia grayii TaxID=363190 RepID=A0ABD1KSP2_9TELE
MEDVCTLFPVAELTASPTVAILQAVSDLVNRTAKPSSDSSYRCLRRKLMESLRGPALKIVKAAQAADSDISPEDCLEAHEHAFGTAESGDDLYFALRLLQQQAGEKLSDFLRQLEQSLNRVVQRGGIRLSCTDRAQLEQLFAWCCIV